MLTPLKMKYSGINLKVHVQELYEKKYKTLINEIKEELKNGEIFHIHG